MMWMILKAEKPDDWVIAKLAFKHVRVEVEFKGQGVDEVGIVSKCSNNSYKLNPGQTVVCVDPKYFRPTEVDILVGDPSKAKNELGWEPKISLEELVEDMMKSDLKLMQKDLDLKKLGYEPKNYFE